MRHGAVLHADGLVHHHRAGAGIDHHAGPGLRGRRPQCLRAARGNRRAACGDPAHARESTRASTASAVPAPNCRLIASTARCAVPKSDRLSSSENVPSPPTGASTARSTSAAGRNAARAQLVDLHLAAVGRGTCAADHHVALRHRIGRAIDALERRHQQRAATQALGIAHRRHGHVDGLPGPRERRQRGRHHHRRHVLQLHVHALRNRDAQLLQHVVQALRGERRLHRLVAGAVEAHHQAVADQRVVPHALNAGELLEPLGMRRRKKQSASTATPRCASEPRNRGMPRNRLAGPQACPCKGGSSDTKCAKPGCFHVKTA